MTEQEWPDTENAAADPQESASADAPALDSTSNPASDALSMSPGALVRHARERQGMSVDGLTARTLLNRKTVEALENDEFGRLSQPVFARGYYRKCAKVLGIPEPEIMAAYARWAGEDSGLQAATAGQVHVVPEDASPQPRWALRSVLVVLVLLAVGALALAWLPQWFGSESQPANREANAAGAGQAAGLDAPPTAVEDARAEGGESSREDPAITTDASTAGQSPGRPESLPEPAGATAAAGEQGAGPAPPAKLVLRFAEKSWVRIRDAGGSVLLNGTVGGGNLRVVQGSPPFDVALGNAPAVALSIDGRSIKTASRTGADNTARLTIRADGPLQ